MTKTTFTLGEAALAVDYAKSKISNDIKAGKLSATREEPGGPYSIDGSELARVYGGRFKPERLTDRSGTPPEDTPENERERLRTPENPLILQNENAMLRERLSMLTQLHESEIKQLSARIEDMRANVEDAHGQRDRAMALLTEQIAVTKQLTDQRPKEGTIPMGGPSDEPARAATGGERRGFFGLFGRR